MLKSCRSWRLSRAGVLLVAVLAFTAQAATAGAAVHRAGTKLGFTIYNPPLGTPGRDTADEPSIGADWKTGATMYQSNVTTLRVNFNDAVSPPAATWTDVSAPLTSLASLDPILFTDPETGRTIVSQLDVACSLSEHSNDDGATWTPSTGCAQNGSEDHQTVGGGPFAAPLPANPVYPHAVYYCNQDGGVLVAGGSTAAYCGISLDGGLTYTPGHPIYTFSQCGGLHGHIRVSPDGTAVVPNQNCGPAPDTSVKPPVTTTHTFANQAAVVSTDNGTTWAVHVIPDSSSTLRSDPSVAADSANKLYFGYEGGVWKGDPATGEQVGGRAMISTSSDDGTTWSKSVDVGAPLGIQNVTFPEVIAGSPGRAAYAFLGSTTAGNPENTGFPGFWYLYAAFTSDGGRSWSVQNLTPGDPVERGCIYLAGNGSCPSSKRNLLDFMDITRDKLGRVEIGYADGCTGTCVTDQSQPCSDPTCGTGPTSSKDTLASIARETCGIGLVDTTAASLSCAAPAPAPVRAARGRVRAPASGAVRRSRLGPVSRARAS